MNSPSPLISIFSLPDGLIPNPSGPIHATHPTFMLKSHIDPIPSPQRTAPVYVVVNRLTSDVPVESRSPVQTQAEGKRVSLSAAPTSTMNNDAQSEVSIRILSYILVIAGIVAYISVYACLS